MLRSASRRDTVIGNAWMEHRVTRQCATGNGDRYVAQEDRPPAGFVVEELGMGGSLRECECGRKNSCRLDSCLISQDIAEQQAAWRKRVEAVRKPKDNNTQAKARARAKAAAGQMDRDGRARLLADMERRRAVA